MDWKAREACVGFLEELYPSITREQSEKLIELIFENNFKSRLPNHFGKRWGLNSNPEFGFPYIWLLNELEVNGIQYLYQNEIWQIHWDVSNRYEGIIKEHERETVKYLVTRIGPCCEEGQRFCTKHRLVFWGYSHLGALPFEYPFPEDLDLSGSTEFEKSLKLAEY